MTSWAGVVYTKKTLLNAHLSRAAASGTGDRLRTVLRARALACVAIIPTWHTNGFCGAAHCLLKGNLHGITQISAARRAATTSATKNIAKHVAKNKIGRAHV